MFIKPIPCVIAALISAATVSAQSDFDLTQRWFNESIYNPGATGNSFTTGVFAHSRAQWLRTDGAPITNAFSFDTYVDEIRSGFGLSVLTDKIGYINSWTAKLSYAYYIPITKSSSLAVGLSAYLHNRNSNILPGMVENSSDPAITYTRVNEFTPDFDFGIEYKGSFKFGASIRHLVRNQPVQNVFPIHSMNIWTYASSRFNMLEGMSIEPVVSYMRRGDINRYEAGAIAYFFKSEKGNTYNDRFWIGAMYRLNNQFAVLAGVNATSKIRIGYSFDYGVGNLTNISKMGTHELFLSWHFKRIFYKDADCPAYRSYTRKPK